MKKSNFKNNMLSVLSVLAFSFAFVFAAIGTPATAGIVSAGLLGTGAIQPNVNGRAYTYLTQMLNQQEGPFKDLSTQLKADIFAGKQVLETFTYYTRKRIGTAGIAKVIETTDEKKAGLRNFDKAKFGDDTLFILTDIFLNAVNIATVTDPADDSVVYSNLIWDLTTNYANGTVDTDAGATGNQFVPVAVRRVPEKLIKAEFMLRNGTEPVQSGSVNQLFVNNLNGVVVPAQSGLTLDVPKVLRGDKAVEFEIEFPESGSISNNLFVELQLVGCRLRSRI